MIDLFALDIEHHIREVVVLVDDEIEFPLHPLGIEVDYVQLADKGFLFKHFGEIFRWIERLVPPREVLRHGTAIDIEALRQRLDIPADPRKVQVQHLELSHKRSRVLLNPESGEQTDEIVLFQNVVVAPHHGQEQALPETPRSDEEQKMPRCFHFRKILCLVRVVKIFPAHLREVGNPVRYELVRCHSTKNNKRWQKYENSAILQRIRNHLGFITRTWQSLSSSASSRNSAFWKI